MGLTCDKFMIGLSFGQSQRGDENIGNLEVRTACALQENELFRI